MPHWLGGLHSLLDNAELYSLYTLILAVVLERWLRWPEKYHPLTLVRLLAMGMAFKVNRRPQGIKSQELIAGTLAPLVLLGPLILMGAFLLYLAEFYVMFDGLFLLTALWFQPVLKQAQTLYSALRAGKKSLARQQLQTIVKRNTSNLSVFGMAKAGIESLLVRFSHQYCTVIIIYLLFGGLASLSYRLLFECSHCWNSRLSQFRFFGQPSRRLLNLLQWLPARLATLCFLLANRLTLGSSLKRPFLLACSRDFMLHFQGSSLGIQLGGPVYYEADKLRMRQCGGTRKVRDEDIIRTVRAIQRTKWVLLSVCVISQLIFYSGVLA